MQTHLMPRPLPNWGINSQAYWSLQPNRKAIVFVHGFKGSALNTWLEFPRLLQQMQKCAGCDLIFYGYDGARMRATNSAYLLRKFLKQVVENPRELANQSLQPFLSRAPNFSYDNVIICAHSLGAVVSRQALLDAHLSQEKWACRTRLVLFAPAHLGAGILPLVCETIGAVSSGLRFVPKVPFVGLVLQVLVFVMKLKLRVLRDLEPGCKTLEKLLSDTSEAIKGGGANFLIAPAVLHASDDDVVEPIRFAQDPPHELIPGKSHTGACKPSVKFLQPIQAVTKLL